MDHNNNNNRSRGLVRRNEPVYRQRMLGPAARVIPNRTTHIGTPYFRTTGNRTTIPDNEQQLQEGGFVQSITKSITRALGGLWRTSTRTEIKTNPQQEVEIHQPHYADSPVNHNELNWKNNQAPSIISLDTAPHEKKVPVSTKIHVSLTTVISIFLSLLILTRGFYFVVF